MAVFDHITVYKMEVLIQHKEISKYLEYTIYGDVLCLASDRGGTVLHTEDASDIQATPLYRLALGVADSSGGIPCARKAGTYGEVLTQLQ